jgi:hypothetical protein
MLNLFQHLSTLTPIYPALTKYSSPICPAFLPPLYSTGQIRHKYESDTGQMREKGVVAISKARSKYGFDTGVPGECCE